MPAVPGGRMTAAVRVSPLLRKLAIGPELADATIVRRASPGPHPV